jgi:hypothetical protein
MLHINLENSMTPSELYTLFHQIALNPSLYEKHQTDWIMKLYSWYTKSGMLKPEIMKSQIINNSVVKYTNNTRSRDKKILFICFAGKGQRFFMPTPIFLQYFDFNACDLLYVQSYKRNVDYCENGLPELSNDFMSAMEELYKISEATTYHRVISFGSSSGGMPSLIMTLKYGLDACIMVSPKLNPQWQEIFKEEISSFLQKYVSNLKSVPKLFSLFVDGYEPDQETTYAYKKMLPMLNIHKVKHNGSKLHPHNAIGLLVEKGILRTYLSDIILLLN